jgi:hypothetical protein
MLKPFRSFTCDRFAKVRCSAKGNGRKVIAVHGGGGIDSLDTKSLKHAARNLISDLHIDTLNVIPRNFR